MPRGSSSTEGQGGYGAGEAGAAAPVSEIPMLRETGSASNTGRYTIRKTYLTTDKAQLTSIPTPPSGFRPTALNWQALGGGAYEKTVDFEYFVGSAGAGGNGGSNPLVETINGVSGRFELDVQDELKPIGGHPNIRKLLEKYNGQIDGNNKVSFPPLYTPAGADGLGVGQGQQTNPMAGKLFYSKPAAIFRHIQQMQFVPADIWNNVGKKVESLPAGFPNLPPEVNDNGEEIKYYWIVLSPQIYRRGNAYEVIRTYKLSEANSPDELHDLTTPSTTNTGGGITGPQPS